MSNKAKDTLFELIQNLSKSEKRYFKVFASRHVLGEQNNYTILFDFIENLSEYDEQKIMEAFKGEAFLNKFSITKKRLYDQIISSLDNFYSSSSSDAQIFKLISSAEILFQKALYQQSVKQLKSAEKLAAKYHKYNLLAEINLKLKRIYETQGQTSEKEIQSLMEKDLAHHSKSLTYDKLWNIKQRLFHLLNSKGISRNDSQWLEFNNIIDELAKEEQDLDLYIDSEYLVHHIQSAYHFATNSYTACLEHLLKNVTLLETQGDEIQDKNSKYLSTLTNAIYLAFRLKENALLLSLRKKLKALADAHVLIDQSAKNEDFHIKLFSSYYSIELTILLMEGKIDAALKVLPIVEKGITTYQEKLTESRKAFFAFKIAAVHFANHDFHQALKYINQLLNNQDLDQQEDMVSFAHLMALLIHLEIKNTDLLPYVLRSTLRFLKSRNRLYEFEQVFMKFINKLVKLDSELDREEQWSKFYLELAKNTDEQMQRVSFEYFDFIQWAKAKAERKSYKMLLQA